MFLFLHIQILCFPLQATGDTNIASDFLQGFTAYI